MTVTPAPMTARYRYPMSGRFDPNPPGVKRVTRPSRWGNPHPVESIAHRWCGQCGEPHTATEAVDRYRRDAVARTDLAEWLAPLADAVGLACTCPLDQPCHADVLLELLNTHYPKETR